MMNSKVEEVVCISVIIPVYNAEKWLDECLESILQQTSCVKKELSVYNDSSTDCSAVILNSWQSRFESQDWCFTVTTGGATSPRGVGYAKNQAVERSRGAYLCFVDADDVVMPERLERQLEACEKNPNAIVGSRFVRSPQNSTPRYTNWANALTERQLYTQAYTSNGPTVIMPTWFCSRSQFNAVGPFCENGKGCPEDLLFFYRHLSLGGMLYLVPEVLTIYRYHAEAATFSVLEDTIWDLRVAEFEDKVLSNWDNFTIWNAGKQGKKFFRSISDKNRKKVKAFCDVDEKKLAHGVYEYYECSERPKPRIPIIHFSRATPPIVCCMKLGWPGCAFESNLAALKLEEGRDYYHFN